MLSMLLLQQPNLRYFLYFQVTHKSNVVPMLFLGLSFVTYFAFMTTTFFQVPKSRILNNIRDALFTGTF